MNSRLFTTVKSLKVNPQTSIDLCSQELIHLCLSMLKSGESYNRRGLYASLRKDRYCL